MTYFPFVDSTASPASTQITKLTTTAAITTLNVTEEHTVISSTEKITTETTQNQTTTAHTAVTSKSVSLSTLPSSSPQTPNRTEETKPSQTPETTTNHLTSNETVSHGATLQPASHSPNVTEITINTTSTGQTAASVCGFVFYSVSQRPVILSVKSVPLKFKKLQNLQHFHIPNNRWMLTSDWAHWSS